MIKRKPKEPKPYPTKGGHISGDGTFNDAPLPPGMPTKPYGQQTCSCGCGCESCGGAR